MEIEKNNLSEDSTSKDLDTITPEKASFKLKKFMVSTLSSNVAGRKIIKSIVGKGISNIMNALSSTMTKFSGRKKGKEIQACIYRVGSFCAVYYEENILNKKMMESCKEPNVVIIACMIEQLQTPLRLRNIEVIQSLIDDCYSAVHSVLLPIMSVDTMAKLSIIKEYISSGFIEFFMLSPEAEIERSIILACLTSLLQPYQAETTQLLTFLENKLLERRRELTTLVSNPTLLSFLKHRDTFKIVSLWLVNRYDPKMAKMLNLYIQIHKYLCLTSRSLIQTRGLFIYETCISPNTANQNDYVELPEYMVKGVEHTLETNEYSLQVFEEVEKYIYSALEGEFNRSFAFSESFNVLQEELAFINQKLIACFHVDPSSLLDSSLYRDDPTSSSENTPLKESADNGQDGSVDQDDLDEEGRETISINHDSSKLRPRENIRFSFVDRISFWQNR